MVSINVLQDYNSLLNQYLLELRDIEIQKDSMRFRKNLERVSEIIAYEISKTLNYSEKIVSTSLGESKCKTIVDKIVLATILRAGLPMHTGLLNYFDHAENAFISAYRQYYNDGSFDIQFEYLSSPELDNKVLLLADPMLATGASIVIAFKGLLERGIPEKTHIISLIASRDGLEYVKSFLNDFNITIWIVALDDELTAKGYIIPGLGDAGDLAFGIKV